MILNEASLQALLKKGMKKSGTIDSVFGDQAEAAAKALMSAPTEAAYVLDSASPNGKVILKSLSATPQRRDDDATDFHLTRIFGRRILVWQGKAITSQSQFDQLVEADESFKSFLKLFKEE